MKGDTFYIGARIRFNKNATWKDLPGKTGTIVGQDLRSYPNGKVWLVDGDDKSYQGCHLDGHWHQEYFDLIKDAPIDIAVLL